MPGTRNKSYVSRWDRITAEKQHSAARCKVQFKPARWLDKDEHERAEDSNREEQKAQPKVGINQHLDEDFGKHSINHWCFVIFLSLVDFFWETDIVLMMDAYRCKLLYILYILNQWVWQTLRCNPKMAYFLKNVMSNSCFKQAKCSQTSMLIWIYPMEKIGVRMELKENMKNYLVISSKYVSFL